MQMVVQEPQARPVGKPLALVDLGKEIRILLNFSVVTAKLGCNLAVWWILLSFDKSWSLFNGISLMTLLGNLCLYHLFDTWKVRMIITKLFDACFNTSKSFVQFIKDFFKNLLMFFKKSCQVFGQIFSSRLSFF